MIRKSVVSIALCLAFSGAVVSEVQEWPQWRGPNRDGTVEGPAWPDTLDGLEPIWRVELGKGYPGPIVTRDRVFVAETSGGDTEVVRALDRASGEQLWEVAWPGKGSVPFFAAKNGDWIRSTPAWDGENLYVGGMNELLVSLDGATGRENWRIDFPERYGTGVPPFGFASSPLVDGDHLYVQAADSIIKLDKATGETAWRALASDSGMMSAGAFSSPVLRELNGQRQLLVQTRASINGLDPENGEVLWTHEVPSFRGMNILTPTVFGDGVFTSSYRNGSYFYGVSGEGAAQLATQSWNEKGHGYMSSPVVVDGHAYLHLGNGRMASYDLATGERKWTSTSMGEYSSLATQGDKILMLTSEGELHLVRANPESFEKLDSREIADQSTWGYLAIAGDEIFVRELEAVAAYRWQRPATEVETSP